MNFFEHADENEEACKYHNYYKALLLDGKKFCPGRHKVTESGVGGVSGVGM